MALALAVAWGILALDLMLFNTTMIVLPVLVLLLLGATLYLWLNCYAALMELDYYNQQGFRMRYPGTILPQIESHDKPVDWMYLVNGINAMGVPCPREVVWESVAENIFAEIMPGLKDRRKSVRDNIRDAGYGERDRLGKPQCYLSFGMASIETPALNLQDALSYRLTADVLAHWPFTQAAQEDHVRLVDTDIEAWRLKPEQLEEDLVKDDAGIAQLQRIHARTADQKAGRNPCSTEGVVRICS